ncbi:MAG: hypothetical protein ABW019_16075 [Chitinophagaceae bacterium]
MKTLTTGDKNVCSYTGVFGILIAATCLFQNLLFFNPHSVTTALILIYLVAITAFSLLIAQHQAAPVLLIITTALLIVGLLLLLINAVVSMIVGVLFLYAVVITSVVYAEGFPAKFRQKALAERAERDLWKDKI